jgi:hypothetical protein
MTAIVENHEMKKTVLAIAGTSVAIQTDDATAFFLPPLQDFFRGFLQQRGPAAAQLTISYNHIGIHRQLNDSPIPLVRKDRETGELLCHLEKLYPLSDSALLIGFLNGVLAYNVLSQRGHLFLFRSDGRNLILGSLHKLLFLFLAMILAEQGKFMLHGAGIRLGSEGCLFLGASGAGKSTVAGQVDRKSLLSDDAPVITQNGRSFVLHASPFSQVNLFDLKAANHHRKETPLTRLVFLRQANHLDLEHRERRSALAELLRGHVHGFDVMDRDLKTRIFRFCCDLCESVPAFDLYFQKNDRFLSLFRSLDHSPLARPD